VEGDGKVKLRNDKMGGEETYQILLSISQKICQWILIP